MGTVVNLLGDIAIYGGATPGGRVRLERQEQAVFGYLLLDSNRVVERARLLEVLWPERSPDSGCHCLSTALWRLRRDLGEIEGIAIDTARGAGIRLRVADSVKIDFQHFRQLVEPIVHSSTYREHSRLSQEDLRQVNAAIAVYRGPLLPGIEMNWVEAERQVLEEEYLQCLALLGRHYDEVNEYERALEIYRRILKLDPAREEIHRCIMVSYEKLGLRSMALRQFAVCVGEMRESLGVEVMAETSRLAAAISHRLDAGPPPDPLHAKPGNSAGAIRLQLEQLFSQVREATSALVSFIEKLEECGEPELPISNINRQRDPVVPAHDC